MIDILAVVVCTAFVLIGLGIGYFAGYRAGQDYILGLWRKSDHDAVLKPEPRLGVLDDHAE